MTETNETRFVIIDDVQYSRARAVRLGLLEAPKAETKAKGAPANNKARTAASAAKGKPGTAPAVTAPAPAAPAAAAAQAPADAAAGSAPGATEGTKD